MKKIWLLLLLFVLLTPLVGCGGGGGSSDSSSGFTVSGVVKQQGANIPLSGVKVTLGSATTTTNASGAFSLTGVSQGSYTLQAELQGYTTYQNSLNVASSQTGLNIELTTQGPAVNIANVSFTNDSGQTITADSEINATKLKISGSINNLVSAPPTSISRQQRSTAITVSELQAIVNGAVYTVMVETDGSYNQMVPVEPGSNTIQLRVFDGAGHAGTSQVFRVQVTLPRLDLRVVLKWDTDVTDVDLHMFKRNTNEPNPAAPTGTSEEWIDTTEENRHVCYYEKTPSDFGSTPAQNPFLDIDDMDGFGPETVVLQEATSGRYHVWVHYYSAYGTGGEIPSNATVTVIVNGGTAQARSYEYTKQLLHDWEYWYVCTVDWPSGTIINQPPSGSVQTVKTVNQSIHPKKKKK